MCVHICSICFQDIASEVPAERQQLKPSRVQQQKANCLGLLRQLALYLLIYVIDTSVGAGILLLTSFQIIAVCQFFYCGRRLCQEQHSTALASGSRHTRMNTAFFWGRPIRTTIGKSARFTKFDYTRQAK